MKNKHPLVSVIMPVYNAGDFLRPSIESVLHQTYKNWELVAVDDGSKDSSWEVLRALAKKDKRIRVYKTRRNIGLGSTANLAISKAKARYLARFDADDLMPANRLETQTAFLKKHPQVVAVGGQCLMIDENNAITGRKSFPVEDKKIRQMSFLMMPLQAGAMMINRELLPKHFSYYTRHYRYAEDHELLFKLFLWGKAANLDQVMLYYRQHSQNSTSLVSAKEAFKSIFAIRREAAKYIYQPNLIIDLLSWLQYLLVLLLPEKVIKELFAYLRGMKQPVIVLSYRLKPLRLLPRFGQLTQHAG